MKVCKLVSDIKYMIFGDDIILKALYYTAKKECLLTWILIAMLIQEHGYISNHLSYLQELYGLGRSYAYITSVNLNWNINYG